MIGYRLSQHIHLIHIKTKNNEEIEKSRKLSEIKINELDQTNIINTIVPQYRQKAIEICETIHTLTGEACNNALHQLSVYSKIDPRINIECINLVAQQYGMHKPKKHY